jgi:hypothetical protein
MRVGRLLAPTFAIVLSSSRLASAREVQASDVEMIGLQTSFTRVRGSDRDAEIGALGLSMSRVGFGFEKGFGVRVVNTGSLALGDKGLQGGLGTALAGGFRLPVHKTHGVVLRGGYDASFFGNKYVWSSMIELPQMQLGYQWLTPSKDASGSMVDVVAKGGYLWLGRHNTGDAGVRKLDASWELGGAGSLHMGPVNMRVTYTHIVLGERNAPVDQVEAAICGQTKRVFVCETLRYEVGDVRVPGGTLAPSRVSFLGLTVGLMKQRGRLD